MVAVEARKPGVALESADGVPRYSEVRRKRVPEARGFWLRRKKLKRMFSQGPPVGVVKDWPKAAKPLEVPPVLLVRVAA